MLLMLFVFSTDHVRKEKKEQTKITILVPKLYLQPYSSIFIHFLCV
jgi:hypothetical protein